MKRFIERSTSEVQKHDACLGLVNFGINLPEMYKAWANYGGRAHIYIVDGCLYARGTASEKQYAAGFFDGWRNRTE